MEFLADYGVQKNVSPIGVGEFSGNLLEKVISNQVLQDEKEFAWWRRKRHCRKINDIVFVGVVLVVVNENWVFAYMFSYKPWKDKTGF